MENFNKLIWFFPRSNHKTSSPEHTPYIFIIPYSYFYLESYVLNVAVNALDIVTSSKNAKLLAESWKKSVFINIFKFITRSYKNTSGSHLLIYGSI